MDKRDDDESQTERSQDIERMRRFLQNDAKKKHLIVTHDDPSVQKWDGLIMVMLAFTAFVTPVEVTFIPSSGDFVVDWLFVVNRVVDIVFAIDMILQFFCAFKSEENSSGSYLVTDHRIIAIHYMRTWFVIDLVSIIPFGMLLRDDRLQAVRVIRLLRLLKLVKILKASQVFQRWERNLAISYAKLEMVKLMVALVLFCHWFACAWGMTGALQPEEDNWIVCNSMDELGSYDLYIRSLHWAVMTITSIGYGDIGSCTTTEFTVGIILQLLGGGIWAFIIGNLAGIASTLDPYGTMFRTTMDDVNFFMTEQGLPNDIKVRVREYFSQAMSIAHTAKQGQLLSQMSPMLRADVAHHCNSHWLVRIPYFEHFDKALIGQLAIALQPVMYAPQEPIRTFALHIVNSGLAVSAGRIKSRGKHFGLDAVLNALRAHPDPPSPDLHTRSLTYLEVLVLPTADLVQVLDHYPDELCLAKKVACRTLMRRTFVHFVQLATAPGAPGDSQDDHNILGPAAPDSDVLMAQHRRSIAASLATGDTGASSLNSRDPGGGEWEEGLNQLHGDMVQVKTELREDIQEVSTKMQSQMDKLREEVRAEVRAEMRAELQGVVGLLEQVLRQGRLEVSDLLVAQELSI